MFVSVDMLTLLRSATEMLEVDDSPTMDDSVPHSLPAHRGQSQTSRFAMTCSSLGVNPSDLGAQYHRDAPRSDRPRVEKKIRMRVRWECHACLNAFGRSPICSHCGHRKCSECLRCGKRRRVTQGAAQPSGLPERTIITNGVSET
jgi:hypothetical protein